MLKRKPARDTAGYFLIAKWYHGNKEFTTELRLDYENSPAGFAFMELEYDRFMAVESWLSPDRLTINYPAEEEFQKLFSDEYETDYLQPDHINFPAYADLHSVRMFHQDGNILHEYIKEKNADC